MTGTQLRVALVASLLALPACGSSIPRQPPGLPPTPSSITMAHPGGDAADPHRAALNRLLYARWGARDDKHNRLHAPMPDWRHWRRVHYWGVKQFTGFRYGDVHHVMAIVFVQPVPKGMSTDSLTCMHRFEAWVRPQIRGYDVHLGPIGVHTSKWRHRPMRVEYVDGDVDLAFMHHPFSAAWAAYPRPYPDACLIYAIAVPWRGSKDLAQELRDRFVIEGFQRMRLLTHKAPKGE